ncbi:unnamed protein product, partial [Amoebophrya sp. A25]|eukprot:GSA25T00007674001.1
MRHSQAKEPNLQHKGFRVLVLRTTHNKSRMLQHLRLVLRTSIQEAN